VGLSQRFGGPSKDEAPTVVEGSAAVPSQASRARWRASETPPTDVGASSTSRSDTYPTPGQTLRGEDIARARTFAVIASVFALFVAVIVLFLHEGDPNARHVLLVGLFALITVCAWDRWQLRRDEGFSVARTNVVTHVGVLASYAGVWYFGMYSPAIAIITFGLAFFSLTQDRRSVIAMYACSAAYYALMSAVVISGLARDPGFVPSDVLTRPQQVACAFLVEGILLATYVFGRRTRDVSLAALEEHDRAVRSLAQREALLREARHELAHAMQAGGIGRWTDELVGSFRLGRLLGRGAMGEVYEAAHAQSGQPAAVKLLHPHVLGQPEFVQRFVREARVVASLDVPNVVKVLEVSAPDAGVPYLAMERLVGRDLSELLREHKRMGIQSVLAMVRQIGVGLDAARAAGIVHRDLKPRNVFLAREGTWEGWKILDFGVARVAGEETLTHNQIVGTPSYMAPEQANGTEVTHRTDLYALGVIAYRALTGHPAFEGEKTAEILYKVVHAMPLRPSVAAPVNPDVDLALSIAIAKGPEDRFASAGELAAALEAASTGSLHPTLRARAERLLAALPWAGAPE
jgi:serine/threonine-protein kinase